MSIREIQLHQLEMLKVIVKVLEEENISYFAIGGTALGAIRHEGFIPWDDDIDLAILREDYDKFLKIQSKLPKNFRLLNHSVEKNYPLFFSKIVDQNKPFHEKRLSKYSFQQGVFIDFFPWDKFSNFEKSRKQLNQAHKKFKRLVLKRNGNLLDIIKYFLYKVRYGFINSYDAYIELDRLAALYKNEDVRNWGYPTLNDYLHEDEIFPLRKQKFEDFYICIPNKCEKYLTQKYGDYMVIPKEGDRYNHSTLRL